MQNACRGFSLPRGREAKDTQDITSETKEQDHMTSKSAFLSCEKILSHFGAGGGNFEFLLFCCHVRGRSWSRNLSFGPLLLVITSHGVKVLRAQVAERTEKEEDVNRLTFKL